MYRTLSDLIAKGGQGRTGFFVSSFKKISPYLPSLIYETLGSVNLAIFLISVAAATVLLGSWCPQAPQVGREKVVERFGESVTAWLEKFGITDIFHTPFFLILVSLLAINLLAASLQRVFPRAISKWRSRLATLSEEDMARQPLQWNCKLKCDAGLLLNALESKLRKAHYRVLRQRNELAAQRGKVGVLAAGVTHIGLITLLSGATITSWTGFSGFEAIARGGMLTFMSSEHSKLWIGRLPNWRVKVEDTYRVNYKSGDPKQWYSELAVIDSQGKVLKRQTISVNNPLFFEGVDIYQSSWAFDHILLSFNGVTRALAVHPMGSIQAAFLPLDDRTIFIFSAKDVASPLRVFAKTEEWAAPKLITTIAAGMTAQLGPVQLRYDGPLPTTGLQYKCDPGFPLTLTGFVFIIAGITLAAVPYRQLWICVKPEEGASEVKISGVASKAKRSLQADIDKLLQEL
jgi:cytochrome c biogenesis protein